MRKKIVAGNWKMNLTLEAGKTLAVKIDNYIREKKLDEILIILSTPFIHLTEVKKIINCKNIFLAAQNCHSEDRGAFTGEVSAEMIRSCRASYVIIGHSERREYFSEGNDFLNKKVKCCLKNDLIPVYCCGEKLNDRENDLQFEVVGRQLEEGLFDLGTDEFSKIIIAYEPVWAIGTGRNATPSQAQEMHEHIRKIISAKYGNGVSNETHVLYGGSCNASNASELFSKPDVDGGLVGGASLFADEFLKIIQSF